MRLFAWWGSEPRPWDANDKLAAFAFGAAALWVLFLVIVIVSRF